MIEYLQKNFNWQPIMKSVYSHLKNFAKSVIFVNYIFEIYLVSVVFSFQTLKGGRKSLEYGEAFDIETTINVMRNLCHFTSHNRIFVFYPCFWLFSLPKIPFFCLLACQNVLCGMSFIFSLFFSLANDWLRLEEFIHLGKSLNSYLNVRLFPVSNTVLVKHTCFWHVRHKRHAQWISSA